MRSFDDEMELRRKQRERYFENPNFVMWSDIVKYYNDLPYEMISDEMFFDRYLRYCNDGEDTFNLRDLLKRASTYQSIGKPFTPILRNVITTRKMVTNINYVPFVCQGKRPSWIC